MNGVRKRTWLTAIPMVYREQGGFWDRDVGLLCTAFRELGFDCRFAAVRGSDVAPDDRLILGSWKDFESPAWWRQWRADCVVMTARGDTKYEPIARAVRESGSQLMLKMDSHGMVSPAIDFAEYVRTQYHNYRDRGFRFPAALALASAMVKRLVPASYDRPLLRMLSQGDHIGIETPGAAERLKDLFRAYNREDLAGRVMVVPHPVMPLMRVEGSTVRRKRIIAVGRWESHVKNAPGLIRVLSDALAAEPDYDAVVIGSGESILRKLADRMPGSVRKRLEIVGSLPHEQMADPYRESQIFLLPSWFETFNIASAEALCCGCSIVGPPHIPSVHYFTSHASGTVAAERSMESLAMALRAELDCWRRGLRDASAIASYWSGQLHAESVAREIIHCFESV